jgi:two-component system chemotaxis response regulator CheB
MSARILIGASSHAFGRGLADSLERDAELTVVGILDDTTAIVRAAERMRPDMVALELDLPGAGGIAATQRIMHEHPTRIVVITSHHERRSPLADAAIAAGAVGVIPRSAVALDAPDSAAGDALRHRFRRLAGARLGAAAGSARALAAVDVRRAAHEARVGGRRSQVVGICASTGGPGALARVLRHLPAEFPLPVLVVQHMGGGFIDGFARWLDGELPLAVRVASAGEPLGPGIRLAPDGAHLILGAGRRLELDHTTVVGSHRPSADVLLCSLARVAGAGAIAVVLTGMGRDGAAGVKDVVAAGGRTIAQDEASSAIYGMPRAAAECGAQRILPLDAIGPLLLTLGVKAGQDEH